MNMMNAHKLWNWIPALLVCGAVGMAYAKLPPAPPVDPAKAAEAKAKAAEANKKARELEEKYMDRAVERYKKEKGVKAAGAPAAKK
jgi:uncharacterized membrane protein (DUF106 family)